MRHLIGVTRAASCGETPRMLTSTSTLTSMTAIESPGSAFGANSWLVEEMYEQYRSDPGSVSETWQEFFSDYKPAVPAPAPTPASAPAPSQTATSTPTVATQAAGVAGAAPSQSDGAQQVGEEVGEPIRGAGAAIAANMERSLTVPT